LSTVASSIFLGAYLLLIIVLFALTWKKKWYMLNHENLFSQKLFWIAILTPTLSFIYFGFFSWLGHTPQLNSEGMSNFLSISKLPLLILASVVPLGVIVSNLHRTYQMEAQIKNAEIKNNMDAFYAHYKYHTETLAKICSDKKLTHLKHNNFDELNTLKITIRKPHSVYKLFFPASSPINGPEYTPSTKSLPLLIKRIDNLTSSFSELDTKYFVDKLQNGLDDSDEKLLNVRTNMLKLCSTFSIDEDIREIQFIDTSFENNLDNLRANILRLKFMIIKINYMINLSLNTIGITKKMNTELYEKIKTMKAEVNNTSNNLKSAAISLGMPPLDS